MTTLFTVLITLQFLLILLHDLVDIPGVASGSSLQAELGKKQVIGITLVNAIFPGIAAGLALFYRNRDRPAAVWNYWLIYCGISVVSAIFMWYLPYIRGVGGEESGTAASLHKGTLHPLPPRGGNTGPDLFHMAMHVLFITNLLLVCLLRYRR